MVGNAGVEPADNLYAQKGGVSFYGETTPPHANRHATDYDMHPFSIRELVRAG